MSKENKKKKKKENSREAPFSLLLNELMGAEGNFLSIYIFESHGFLLAKQT